jgi:hypothetical protein
MPASGAVQSFSHRLLESWKEFQTAHWGTKHKNDVLGFNTETLNDALMMVWSRERAAHPDLNIFCIAFPFGHKFDPINDRAAADTIYSFLQSDSGLLLHITHDDNQFRLNIAERSSKDVHIFDPSGSASASPAPSPLLTDYIKRIGGADQSWTSHMLECSKLKTDKFSGGAWVLLAAVSLIQGAPLHSLCSDLKKFRSARLH